MAEQFYTILTNIGKAKIANSLPTGQKVNLTKMKIGDSNGTYYNPSENQTELVHKVYECNVASVDVDENNPSWITITSVVPSDIGGFSIREVGIFDDTNSLIAIGKYPETYKPIASDGSTKELYIKMTLEVTNASSVELKIDPTVILATKKDISNLDAKIEQNNSQLNENVKNIKEELKPIETDNNRCYITFIDDDGSQDFITYLKPVFDKHNVKVNLAINAGVAIGEIKTNVSNPMNIEQLKELQNEGHEITSHTYSHRLGADDQSIEDNENELSKPIDIFNKNGIKCDTLVYPSQLDRKNYELFDLAKKYYKLACNSGIYNSNEYPLNSFCLERVEWTPRTLDTLKGYIDNAFDRKEYLIFYSHSWYEESKTSDATKLLDDLLTYIKSKNIEILTLSKVYGKVGNIIETGYKQRGDFYSISKISETNFSTINMGYANSVDNDPSFYKESLNITVHGSSSTGVPNRESGICYTYKNKFTKDVVENLFLTQIYISLKYGNVYKRNYDYLNNEWNDFIIISRHNDFIFDSVINNLDNPITEYAIGESISICPYSATGVRPTTHSAIVKTYRFSVDSFSYQEYKSVTDTNVYIRNWNNTNSSWGDWTNNVK
jgi:peptidoglycan/xylan/chitin deacetylase (PgdA/CDA1 family)